MTRAVQTPQHRLTHFLHTTEEIESATVRLATGAPPERLTLESTGPMAFDDMTVAKETMLNLRQMGFSLPVDDFGTVFSSMIMIR